MSRSQPVELDLKDRRILLIIGGGIAAFKALDVVRQLTARGASVRVVLTSAGEQFVTKLSATVLSGQEALTDLFTPADEAKIGHIELSRSADLIAVVPATADLMAKMAHGLADDLATTVLLATDTPVLIAPAMNVRMWEHGATQRNADALKRDGIDLVGPVEGPMACGEFGPGRMSEADAIVDVIAAKLSGSAPRSAQPGSTGPLAGRHVVVTSGPTHEPIDPVRYLANRSSGKQGYAIARAAAAAGARVTLVSGPTALDAPHGVTLSLVETARDMLSAVQAVMPADVLICAAAVADWTVDRSADQKLKKSADDHAPTLSLVENPDILKTMSQPSTERPSLVIGFAAETEQLIAHATAKLKRKGCDWIVANDVSVDEDGDGVMGGDANTVHILRSDGTHAAWDTMSKDAVAERLIEEVSLSMNRVRAAAE